MDKRIPAATIRRVWLDTTMSARQAAAQVGLSRVNLWLHAKRLGLPPRKSGRRFTIARDQRFVSLWEAGVRVDDIALVLGCHRMSVARLAREMGLPARTKGQRRITFAEFRAAELLRAMAALAEAENAALKGRAA